MSFIDKVRKITFNCYVSNTDKIIQSIDEFVGGGK